MARYILFLLGTVSLLLVSAPLEGQPAKLLKPVNLGDKVNTKFDETDPFLLADNLRLFYASNEKGDYDLFVAARKTAQDPFNEAAPVKQFNKGSSDERSPFFYAPLKEFYFTSNRIPEDGFKALQNFDIHVAVAGGAPFAMLGVSTQADEMFPWITASGTEMYFTRKSKGGWRVCFTSGPKLGAPDIGRIIEEIPVGFQHATLSPDALTMYLQGPLGKDRTGLYRTTRKKVGGVWQKPKAIVNLNHPDGKQGDMAPALSLDGNTLFFASDRPGGQGGLDLYWIAAAELKTE